MAALDVHSRAAEHCQKDFPFTSKCHSHLLHLQRCIRRLSLTEIALTPFRRIRLRCANFGSEMPVETMILALTCHQLPARKKLWLTRVQ